MPPKVGRPRSMLSPLVTIGAHADSMRPAMVVAPQLPHAAAAAAHDAAPRLTP